LITFYNMDHKYLTKRGQRYVHAPKAKKTFVSSWHNISEANTHE